MSAPLLAQAIWAACLLRVHLGHRLCHDSGGRGWATISASTSFAHDFWTNVIHNGVERKPGEESTVARITAFVSARSAIAIAIVLGPKANVAFLVALAFAVAASANLPVIVFSIFWRRFNTTGAVAGIGTGLIASILLIHSEPHLPPNTVPIFPLNNPGIVSIPLGFLGAYLGARFSREPSAAAGYAELLVRATTGIGAE